LERQGETDERDGMELNSDETNPIEKGFGVFTSQAKLRRED
jgi:hypothetical protein